MSSRLRAIARSTVDIAEQGFYTSDTGVHADIAADVSRAVEGTVLHLPDDAVTPDGYRNPHPAVTVTNETTLTATARVGAPVACLVFASARNPGGGFLNGAQAQEESVARGSALYPCLLAAGDFYAWHRAEPDLAYSDRVIHAPGVPVFRDDRGALLDSAYPVSFLVAAAPNRSAMRNNGGAGVEAIPAILRRRALRVLMIAAAYGHRRLVLGAWGCGVFGNEPAVVADAFAQALAGTPVFDEVVFAVYDRDPAAPSYAAFAKAFS
jgi:uncharacterized protein (TIGR02452 family)